MTIIAAAHDLSRYVSARLEAVQATLDDYVTAAGSDLPAAGSDYRNLWQTIGNQFGGGHGREIATAVGALAGAAAVQHYQSGGSVVENQLVQQKLEGKWPGDSWVEGDEEMAGQTWYWRYRGVATADSNFRALDMEVRTAPKADSPVAMIRTYLSR